MYIVIFNTCFMSYYNLYNIYYHNKYNVTNVDLIKINLTEEPLLLKTQNRIEF